MTYRALRSLSYCLASVLPAACSTASPPAPAFVSVGAALPANWPTPAAVAAGQPAKPLALHFSTLDVPLGSEWSGQLVTTTNAASVELMTNLFSLWPVRDAPGRFHFRYRVFDLPPFLVRGYKLRVFVRDAQGRKSETDVPFRLSGRAPFRQTPAPDSD